MEFRGLSFAFDFEPGIFDRRDRNERVEFMVSDLENDGMAAKAGPLLSTEVVDTLPARGVDAPDPSLDDWLPIFTSYFGAQESLK